MFRPLSATCLAASWKREERALGVDGVKPVEVGLGDIDRPCLDQLDAGVGDNDVEPAEPVDRFGEQPLQIHYLADVGLDSDGAGAHPLDRRDGLSRRGLG
jgi:hypothetical protein